MVFAAFVLVPLGRTRAGCRFYEWDGVTPATWVGPGQLPRARLGARRCGAAFVHALVLIVFYALLPVAIGLLLAGAAGAGAGARAGAVPHGALPAAGDRDRRRRGDVADDLRAADGSLNELLRAVGLGSLAQGWLGDFDLALPAVGLVGTWVMYGLAMVLLMAGVQKIPQSLYDAARVDGAGPVREFFAVTLPGAARRDRGRADADDDRGAAQLRPRLHHDAAAGPATRPRCPAFQVYNRAFQTGRGRLGGRGRDRADGDDLRCSRSRSTASRSGARA